MYPSQYRLLGQLSLYFLTVSWNWLQINVEQAKEVNTKQWDFESDEEDKDDLDESGESEEEEYTD